jgi:hypothetical protein
VEFASVVLTVLLSVVSVLISVLAWRQARAANEIAMSVAHREIRELAFGLHRDLTTGEVAEARNRLGTWRYGTDLQREGIDDGQLIQAFYVVLWCLERMANGDGILRQQQGVLSRLSAKGRDAGNSRDLHRQSMDHLRWHLRENVGNLVAVRAATRMNDAQAWSSLRSAAVTLGCQDILPSATESGHALSAGPSAV